MPEDQEDLVAKYQPKPPKQVTEGLAAAEELRKQLVGEQPEPPPSELQPPPTQQQLPPTQQQPPPTQQQPLAEGETWEQRARSAQGRYESQAAVNKQLSERLNELERSLSAMRAAGAEQPAGEPPTPQPVKLVTEKEARGLRRRVSQRRRQARQGGIRAGIRRAGASG